jgi:hypothetical protein
MQVENIENMKLYLRYKLAYKRIIMFFNMYEQWVEMMRVLIRDVSLKIKRDI